jgi:hypothetical protein
LAGTTVASCCAIAARQAICAVYTRGASGPIRACGAITPGQTGRTIGSILSRSTSLASGPSVAIKRAGIGRISAEQLREPTEINGVDSGREKQERDGKNGRNCEAVEDGFFHGCKAEVRRLDVGGNLVVIGIKRSVHPTKGEWNFWDIIFHGVIHFVCAEQPETRTGCGLQHERSFGILVADRCFAWIRFFKNIQIRVEADNW